MQKRISDFRASSSFRVQQIAGVGFGFFLSGIVYGAAYGVRMGGRIQDFIEKR